jgi:hypothetical protein
LDSIAFAADSFYFVGDPIGNGLNVSCMTLRITLQNLAESDAQRAVFGNYYRAVYGFSIFVANAYR